MKAVMISIQPKWCELIANDEKTIEVRKTYPIEFLEKYYEKQSDLFRNRPSYKMKSFKCYIYCSKNKDKYFLQRYNGKIAEVCSKVYTKQEYAEELADKKLNGKVIGEFVCNKIEKFTVGTLRCDDIEKAACLTYAQMIEYFYKPYELDGNTAKFGYAWHISDLKIYDEPKELRAFNHLNKCPSARQDEYDGTWYCEEVDGENAVVDKTKQFPYDEECIYFDCPSCGGENYENEEYAFCMCNGNKPLTRPPQSWQYCEELEEK